MLPGLFVSPLPALFHRRSAAVPPRPPWPVSAVFRAIINLVVPQIDAPSRCERFGALAVAVRLTVGELAPISAVVAAVKAEG